MAAAADAETPMVHAPEPAERTGVFLPDADSMMRAASAGLLGWIMPGLGHIFIGDRLRGVICLATIVLTFWSGVAIGSVRGTIDPHERSLWFVAQLCTGTNAGLAYALRQVGSATSAERSPAPAPWVSSEIGVHYTGVAGLLNILVILDAMARAERRPAGRSLDERGPPGKLL